jgi:phosphoserine phosphatase
MSLKLSNWNLQAFRTLNQRLVSWRSATLPDRQRRIACYDVDGTVITHDVSDAFLEYYFRAVGMELDDVWERPELSRADYRTAITDGQPKTAFGYASWIYQKNPFAAYEHATQLQTGKTLADVQDHFNRAFDSGLLPTAFPEMDDLINTLSGLGLINFFISASPFFIVAPLLEKLGIPHQPWAVQGIDLYVTHPTHPEPILLSQYYHRKLVDDDTVSNWSSFVREHGAQVTLTDRLANPANHGKGKAYGVMCVARRGQHWMTMEPSESQVVLAAGDNWANDQGMLYQYEGGPQLAKGCAMLCLLRHQDDSIVQKYLRAAQSVYREVTESGGSLIPITQAVSHGANGRFLKMTTAPINSQIHP